MVDFSKECFFTDDKYNKRGVHILIKYMASWWLQDIAIISIIVYFFPDKKPRPFLHDGMTSSRRFYDFSGFPIYFLILHSAEAIFFYEVSFSWGYLPFVYYNFFLSLKLQLATWFFQLNRGRIENINMCSPHAKQKRSQNMSIWNTPSSNTYYIKVLRKLKYVMHCLSSLM